MGKVTLGLVQMSMSADRESNLSKAREMLSEAAAKGAQIACLPELFASRYFPQEKNAAMAAETIPGPTTDVLCGIARESRMVVVGGSVYEKARDGNLYNTSVVIDESGRVVGKYRKVHIPHDESFYEQDYFSSGRRFEVFKTKPARLGVLICFDQWYPEAARAERLLDAEVIFYPTAIGTVDGIEQSEGDWREAWEGVQRGHAISNSVVVAAVNRVGREGRMHFWGGSFVCDQFGKVLARADGEEQVIIAECDLSLAGEIEKGWGFLRNRKPGTYGSIVRG